MDWRGTENVQTFDLHKCPLVPGFFRHRELWGSDSFPKTSQIQVLGRVDFCHSLLPWRHCSDVALYRNQHDAPGKALPEKSTKLEQLRVRSEFTAFGQIRLLLFCTQALPVSKRCPKWHPISFMLSTLQVWPVEQRFYRLWCAVRRAWVCPVRNIINHHHHHHLDCGYNGLNIISNTNLVKLSIDYESESQYFKFDKVYRGKSASTKYIYVDINKVVTMVCHVNNN